MGYFHAGSGGDRNKEEVRQGLVSVGYKHTFNAHAVVTVENGSKIDKFVAESLATSIMQQHLRRIKNGEVDVFHGKGGRVDLRTGQLIEGYKYYVSPVLPSLPSAQKYTGFITEISNGAEFRISGFTANVHQLT